MLQPQVIKRRGRPKKTEIQSVTDDLGVFSFRAIVGVKKLFFTVKFSRTGETVTILNIEIMRNGKPYKLQDLIASMGIERAKMLVRREARRSKVILSGESIIFQPLF
jgi:hypothetical protein